MSKKAASSNSSQLASSTKIDSKDSKQTSSSNSDTTDSITSSSTVDRHSSSAVESAAKNKNVIEFEKQHRPAKDIMTEDEKTFKVQRANHDVARPEKTVIPTKSIAPTKNVDPERVTSDFLIARSDSEAGKSDEVYN